MTEHGDRRGIVRDGLVVGGLCAGALTVRLTFDTWIGPTWLATTARDLSRPALAVLTLITAAVWLVMAIRGADHPLDRWYARFVFAWGLVATALLFRLTRWPLYTLTVIAVVLWASYGLAACLVERYVGRVPWWARIAVLAAATALVGLLVWQGAGG